MKDLDKRGKDKLMHFSVCFAVACASPEIAVGLALGKEYGDYKAYGNHWCWWDLVYDTAGVVLGSIVHYTVKYFISK